MKNHNLHLEGWKHIYYFLRIEMFAKFKTQLIVFLTKAGRSRLRSRLLRLSDRQLNDMGFSRDLLENGLESWPWRPLDAEVLLFDKKMQINDVHQSINQQEKEIRKAIDELNNYSDRELSDLGITRNSIEFVVRNGRPRLDEDPRNTNMNKQQPKAA
jgi:uncharacterized protein YjiS (DUF1127 family)